MNIVNTTVGALLKKVKVKGRGYVSNPDGTIAVTCRETGNQLALTRDEYRAWCDKQGRVCPLENN